MRTPPLRISFLIVLLMAFACAGSTRETRSELATLFPSANTQSLNANRPTLAILFASWCEHCHEALASIQQIRTAAGNRYNVIGISYPPFEEFDAQGNAGALNKYVAINAPGLPLIMLNPPAYKQLGSPSKIPTIYIFDKSGMLTRTYDPSQQPTPGRAELEQVLQSQR
jgi:thiol-disulfide isomerase/thioredoxin